MYSTLYPFIGSFTILGLFIIVYALRSGSLLLFAEGAYLTYFGIFLTIQLWKDQRLEARDITHQSITRL